MIATAWDTLVECCEAIARDLIGTLPLLVLWHALALYSRCTSRINPSWSRATGRDTLVLRGRVQTTDLAAQWMLAVGSVGGLGFHFNAPFKQGRLRRLVHVLQQEVCALILPCRCKLRCYDVVHRVQCPLLRDLARIASLSFKSLVAPASLAPPLLVH